MKKVAVFLLPLLVFAPLLLLNSFQISNAPDAMPPIPYDEYTADWKEIDSLERKGLPKSALEKVEALYDRAVQEENHPQWVKTVIYRTKYTAILEEDGLQKSIGIMVAEAEKAPFPAKPILQSMVAEIYNSYLSENAWKFRDRSEVEGAGDGDIATWSIGRLQSEVAQWYFASLEYPGLREIQMDAFKAITVPGHLDEGLRPTLYDFLLHRAIDHFSNEQTYLAEPAYKFQLEDAETFLPADRFVQLTLASQDTSSAKLRTLRLFQELLQFRLQTDQVPALIDADLKRIRFVYENSIAPDKQQAYLQALESLREKGKSYPIITEVLHTLAQFYYQEGLNYKANTGKDHLQDYLVQAHKLCQEALELFPESLGAQHCANLKEVIEKRELSVQLELVNVPDKPLLARVNFKNLSKAHLKLIRFNDDRKNAYVDARRNDNQAVLSFLNSLPEYRKWSVDLPLATDFREHATEIAIEGLPAGLYVLMASDDVDFKGELTGHLFGHVSNLGYWQREGGQKEPEFVVFHRDSGEPQAGVTAECWVQKYNSVLRKYEWKKVETTSSDQNGFVRPKIGGKDRYFSLLLQKGQDSLLLDEGFSNYYATSQRKPRLITHFFLDRAIYRPGQVVYYKGIVLEMDEKNMPSILPNERVTITFYDANYQEVARTERTTNAYGTFQGNFTAPPSGLLGQMNISSSAGNSRKFFRVEEYKRPRFEVTFEPVSEGYRLNEEVTVTGLAKGLAGNNLDGASVTYRVVRKAEFPWLPWWYRSRFFPWSTEQMEITNGVTTTDENGAFVIKFQAIPDKTIPLDKKPQFTYTVYADVTDINGETRSQSTGVKVGSVALEVVLDLPDQLALSAFKELTVESKNLNGAFEPASGEIILELLKQPSNVFIQRFWDAPDMPMLSETEFHKSFPQYPFGEEHEMYNWEVKREAARIAFNTKEGAQVPLPKVKLEPGVYSVRLRTQDKYGQAVELQKILKLYEPGSKGVPGNDALWWFTERSTFEPGDKAIIFLGTARKNQKVLLEVEHDRQIVRQEWVQLGSNLQAIVHQIEEKHRGNLHVHLHAAGINRSFNHAATWNVPWSNKDLKIEYTTFRDKMEPGAEESWELKISGPKGEKVAAEMVAALYDESLDQFVANHWSFSPFPLDNYPKLQLKSKGYGSVWLDRLTYEQWQTRGGEMRRYEDLNWFGFGIQQVMYRNMMADGVTMTYRAGQRGKIVEKEQAMRMEAAPAAALEADEKAIVDYSQTLEPESGEQLPAEGSQPAAPLPEMVQVRTNLNETVFFFPEMLTDAEGNVRLKFTMNEALTRWKFLGLAHTKDLQSAVTTRSVITQKELMVVPNPPRFFREQDEIEFSAKVVNLSEGALSGQAHLELTDPLSGKPVFEWKNNPQFYADFEVEAGRSARVAWRFRVPDVTQAPVLEHTVVATAGNFSDAERDAAPVLSNRMLVTETLPLPLKGKQQKTFAFRSLQDHTSTTLAHHRFTLEFTSNPAWYAVQALPYLMEYPYECTEQIFSRYYANALAASVANSHPRIRKVFDQWKGTDALESNLMKNQELKSALLEETPWVLEAQSESEQKRNIALLFDLNKMSNEQAIALDKLRQRQLPGGGFPWFSGDRDNWYITQYIVEGLGHLNKLGVLDLQKDQVTFRMVQDAVGYLDNRIVEDYDRLAKAVKAGHAKWEDDHLSNLIIHYLYTRSYFLETKGAQAQTSGALEAEKSPVYVELAPRAKEALDYYLGQSEKYWIDKGLYSQGMIALGLHRLAKPGAPADIVRSLKERSLQHEELGMYWKYPVGFFWHQYPIETHALMIEVFEEVGQDAAAVDDLKVWLLKNKQTTHWKTTKATASAVYALLMTGKNWLLEDQPLSITLGKGKNKAWQDALEAGQSTAEAGTGYFQVAFGPDQIHADMGTIQVENPNEVIAWGGAYWQYFEQLDKIQTFEETPLTIQKQLFRVQLTDRGEQLQSLEEGDRIQVGDKLKVRIELRVDRDMEYVHMKDMRASGFEPMNVLSGFRYQGGLGYYESTRDASTNFFFSYLRKGTYVFEYPLRVAHNGDFSNGITTIQCMYAPEFSSHSEGIRVVVE